MKLFKYLGLPFRAAFFILMGSFMLFSILVIVLFSSNREWEWENFKNDFTGFANWVIPNGRR